MEGGSPNRARSPCSVRLCPCSWALRGPVGCSACGNGAPVPKTRQGTSGENWRAVPVLGQGSRWIVSRWPSDEPPLALAVDASTLTKRFAVLCISGVDRGSAIPGAWEIVQAEEKGSWQPHGIGLFNHLKGCVPAQWTLRVISEPGLYALWLSQQSVSAVLAPLDAPQHAGQCSSCRGSQLWRTGEGGLPGGQPLVWKGRLLEASPRVVCALGCWPAGMKAMKMPAWWSPTWRLRRRTCSARGWAVGVKAAVRTAKVEAGPGTRPACRSPSLLNACG
jgi:hypothetical protein